MTRRGAARTATTVVLVIAVTLATAPAALAGWGQTFSLAPSGTLGQLPVQLAYSSGGATAAAFGTVDVDVPGSAQALLTTRTAGGRVAGPRTLTGVAQVLALGYDGSALELLAGTSPRGLDCCSATEAIQIGSRGAIGRPRTLVGGLTGFTLGRLVTLAGGAQLAAIATERGVWVSQSATGDGFGAARQLSGRTESPISMDAAWLGGEQAIVAWTSGAGGISGATSARAIEVATAAATKASSPPRARVALTVPASHTIDQLQVLRRGNGATLAWIESWSDGAGYHSVVRAADLAPRPRITTLSPTNRLASGLTAAADPGGDQGLAWASCSTQASCTVQATGRPAAGTFVRARTLGPVDPAAPPSLAIAPSGQVVIGWVAGGQPLASVGFGAPARLSSTTYAYDLTVAYGPRRQALASWTQGTLDPSLIAAVYSG